MQSIKIKVGTERSRRLIKIILVLIAVCIFVFFFIRFVPLSQKNDEAALLKLVDMSNPLEENYVPKISKVEGIEVAQSCAEPLAQMLAAARADGCEPVLIEGYLDRKSRQKLYDDAIKALVAEGYSPLEAELLTQSRMPVPGADEHQLGLTVDIVDAKHPDKDLSLTDSDTYNWLSEHCWDYGFVPRYPENKAAITGSQFMPWHYRYVGLESAGFMKELELCLEEYYGWFYSNEVIIVTD
ncbi:MAG: M15 family metallopeptidase [Oscillospiraceae bacterium]|nr:M15 family metallopeptidase [Oscillospiraceae bacterium]